MHAQTVGHWQAEVHRWMKRLGLKQNEFARGAGIDASVLSKALRGKANAEPTVRLAVAYMEQLKRTHDTPKRKLTRRAS